MVQASHLLPLFEPKQFRKIVKYSIEVLKAHKDEYDAIAFTGLSGSMVTPVVAFALNKPMIAVRKEKSPHTALKLEGVSCERYAILDDFIASGLSMTRIIDTIADSKTIGGKPVGIVLWRIATATPPYCGYKTHYKDIPIWRKE